MLSPTAMGSTESGGTSALSANFSGVTAGRDAFSSAFALSFNSVTALSSRNIRGLPRAFGGVGVSFSFSCGSLGKLGREAVRLGVF